VVIFQMRPATAQAPERNSPFHQWVLPDGLVWTQFHRINLGYLLRFPDLADFEVSANGDAVNCFPAPGAQTETAKHLYLNQVLPLALSKQGKLVFHASAVELGDSAVAFMADSGKGKSTLAASFSTSGHRFLTDDGLMLKSDKDAYQVIPSHPSIRLWQDSEAALIPRNSPMAPAIEFTSKSRFLAGDRIPFCDSPRPLKRVYFLGEGDTSCITFETIKPSETLIELVRHSFLLDVEARDLLAAHFYELAKLAKLPIFFRLDYPRRYEDLATLRQAIIEHASTEALCA
jgi:hypothetical protein